MCLKLLQNSFLQIKIVFYDKFLNTILNILLSFVRFLRILTTKGIKMIFYVYDTKIPVLIIPCKNYVINNCVRTLF